MNSCLLFLGAIDGSGILFLFVILFIIHFIPSFIARNRPDFIIVFLVNILTGWSFIGWIAAMYLALRSKPIYIPGTKGSVADELAKLRDLYV